MISNMNISGNEITGIGSPDIMFQAIATIGVIFIIAAIGYAIWTAMK